MNLVPLRTVFFEKRIPQNLPFVKTWQDMENTKPLPQSPKNDPNPAGGAQKKAANSRRTSCGTAENMPYPDLTKIPAPFSWDRIIEWMFATLTLFYSLKGIVTLVPSVKTIVVGSYSKFKSE